LREQQKIHKNFKIKIYTLCKEGVLKMMGKDPKRLRKVFDHMYRVEPLTKVVTDFLGEDTVVFLSENFCKLYPYDALPLLSSHLKLFGKENRKIILKAIESKNPLHGEETPSIDDDESLGFFAINLTLKLYYDLFWNVYYV